MKYLAAFSLLLLSAAPAGAQSQSSALIARMVANLDGVKSYTASMHTDASLHTFPFLSPSLDGVVYHKEPDRNKVVFTSGLPFMAKQFSKVYPQVESPSRWESLFVVSVEGNASGVTTLKLVPRKHGRVDHIDARIDDKSAELLSERWNYNDGGYASLDQSYSNVQGHLMVTGQTGKLDVPHYSADWTTTYKDFKLNADIPDSVFAEN